MTPKQYADAIERLGLSQRAAGAFLGIDERQSRRWIAGDACKSCTKAAMECK